MALGDSSSGLGGCKEARLLPRAGADLCVENFGFDKTCCEYGPGDAILSRKDNIDDEEPLDGVSSGMGDEEAARPRGLRMGSLEAEDGVRADAERTGVGVFFA